MINNDDALSEWVKIKKDLVIAIEKKGVSIKEIASRLNLPFSTINHILNDRYASITIVDLCRIVNAVGLKMDVSFKGIEE